MRVTHSGEAANLTLVATVTYAVSGGQTSGPRRLGPLA